MSEATVPVVAGAVPLSITAAARASVTGPRPPKRAGGTGTRAPMRLSPPRPPAPRRSGAGSDDAMALTGRAKAVPAGRRLRSARAPFIGRAPPKPGR
jgi:hypothetical protein